MDLFEPRAKPFTEWTSAMFIRENRWEGIVSPYSVKDVKRLKGSANIIYNLAEQGSKKLWNMINGKDKNFDGKVDIHDAMLEAKQKAKNEKS